MNMNVLTITESGPFGPNCCQVPVGKGICGETRKLDIIHKFRMLYQKKMDELEVAGDGDCLMEKLELQEEWIDNLTEQNEMLVKVVEELEHEAIERVHILEEKLQRSAQCICEVMNKYRQYDVSDDVLAEPLEKVFRLENDRKNLLEFLRRIREDKKWCTDGLNFFEISYDDLFGSEFSKQTQDSERYLVSDIEKEEQKRKELEQTVFDLKIKLEHINSFGNIEFIVKELKIKQNECDNLKQDMIDMRQVLTEEVASKHDTVLQLKKECQQLEDRCIQADKQTAFRDDIIKELRKEIKQLKQQLTQDEIIKLNETVDELQINLQKSRKLKEEEEKTSSKEIYRLKSIIEDLQSTKRLHEENEKAAYKEICALKQNLENLQIARRMEQENENVTVDEIFKLKAVIEELENEKKLQEENNKCACEEISKLKEHMTELENTRKFQEEASQCALEENVKLKVNIKDLEDLKKRQEENELYAHEEISKLKENIKYLENMKTLQETKQYTCEEISKLKEEIINLKTIKRFQEENIKAASKEIFNLKTIIEQLEENAEEEQPRALEISNLKTIIDELQIKIKQCVCHQESAAKEKDVEIAKLRKSVANLNNILDEAENKIKIREQELSQLSETIKIQELNIKTLEGKLKVCRICKRHTNVQFVNNSEVQTNLDDEYYEEQLEEQIELLHKRDEIIKMQTATLELLQQEIHMLKEQVCEKDRYREEVQYLKDHIVELENELMLGEGKCQNLQTAIDLYLNSINILEATEAKCNLEITQQKATIANLQKALITVKQELETVKQKSADNEIEEFKLISNYTNVICLKDIEKENLEQCVQYISEGYENLQTFNLELELEHCDSLQDIDMLENQLYKYQSLLKCEEGNHKQCRIQVKRLVKQKQCYEEVISYFKQEMALMSDQLINLQKLLTLSYSSVQDENCRLNKAFESVQTLNGQLANQLCAAEQKIQLENQMNQLNETKINELERLIGVKEFDLDRHDKTILNIRNSLKSSLKQNEELHGTIVSLNTTIVQLQNAIQMYELDNNKCKESAASCQEQINVCRQKLEELKIELEKKTGELCKLEVAYNRQNRCLRSAKVELQEIKDQQKNKQCNLRCIIQELEDKFRKSEEKYNELKEDRDKLEKEMDIMSKRESVKEVEIQRYRQIIVDLKKTLIDLNTHLTKRNFLSKCNSEECKKITESTEEILLTCPCEVEFYQGIVDTLKTSVCKLKKKLSDYQKMNEDLTEKCRCSEARLEELSKTQIEKNKECFELRKQLAEKLAESQREDARYAQLANQFEKELGSIRQELELRTKQLDDVKRSAQQVTSCRCVQLACAQEECNNLKEELNKLLKKHCALNTENQRLHQQSAKLQALEENRQLLKGQLEQYLAELHTLQLEKEALVNKNHDLLSELRTVQCSSTKQQRYANDSLKTLETELGDLKNSRNDICLESKNIITYFRAWLDEQKKINEHILNKDRDYRLTIKRLQQRNEDLQIQCNSKCPPYYCTRFATSPMPTCQSPWSLGSQGTASFPNDSPSGSPCPIEDSDWYASSFKNYSDDDDDDDDEDDWVSKVENLTAQVRKTNKVWKHRLSESECCESHVSKDPKK